MPERLTDRAVIHSLLRELGVRPQKRLGQNFLVDHSVVERIRGRVEAAEPAVVLEIGPGIGAITQSLVEVAESVVAVEVDTRLADSLRMRFRRHGNLEVVEQDILEFDFSATFGPEKVFVVGSLPYRITSPILSHLVDSRSSIDTACLITQWEVADKIANSPGKNGSSLGVFIQAYTEISQLKRIRKGAFLPVPEVDSADWEMTFLPKPKFEASEAAFFQVVRTLYRYRRKMVRRALQDLLDSSDIPTVLQAASIDETARGETLAFDALDRLAQACAPLIESTPSIEMEA